MGILFTIVSLSVARFGFTLFARLTYALIFWYRSPSSDGWWVDQWVGSRGFGWEVSFSSGAGGSDREYYFAVHERDKNKSFLAVKPIASQNLRGNRFHLQFIPSHLQLLFIEAHQKIGVLFER